MCPRRLTWLHFTGYGFPHRRLAPLPISSRRIVSVTEGMFFSSNCHLIKGRNECATGARRDISTLSSSFQTPSVAGSPRGASSSVLATLDQLLPPFVCMANRPGRSHREGSDPPRQLQEGQTAHNHDSQSVLHVPFFFYNSFSSFSFFLWLHFAVWLKKRKGTASPGSHSAACYVSASESHRDGGWGGGHHVTFELTGSIGGMHRQSPFMPSGPNCFSLDNNLTGNNMEMMGPWTLVSRLWGVLLSSVCHCSRLLLTHHEICCWWRDGDDVLVKPVESDLTGWRRLQAWPLCNYQHFHVRMCGCLALWPWQTDKVMEAPWFHLWNSGFKTQHTVYKSPCVWHVLHQEHSGVCRYCFITF